MHASLGRPVGGEERLDAQLLNERVLRCSEGCDGRYQTQVDLVLAKVVTGTLKPVGDLLVGSGL